MDAASITDFKSLKNINKAIVAVRTAPPIPIFNVRKIRARLSKTNPIPPRIQMIPLQISAYLITLFSLLPENTGAIKKHDKLKNRV
jgi:hypothetical protein